MKLKVCGLKYNTAEVAELKPDYIGLIFWEGSKRFVSEPLPEETEDFPKKVGVFVDAEINDILLKIREYSLDVIQLHGSENQGYCRLLKERVIQGQGKEVLLIKAFSVGPSFNFKDLEDYKGVCDFYLFDSRGPLPGGNGTSFDWNLLRDYPLEVPYFLSGGISQQDTEKLIEFLTLPASVYCHALDINSGFEISPGLKDLDMIKQFMNSRLWSIRNH